MKSDAWLLDCGDSVQIAVGDREMIELVRSRDCYRIPAAPEYCHSVISWQGRIVPVMDIGKLHGGAGFEDGDAYISVLNYQESPGSILQPVGIRVVQAPSRIVVDDSQVCDWPEMLDNSRLREVCLCCFEYRDDAVLLLDISRLCSAEFREMANVA